MTIPVMRGLMPVGRQRSKGRKHVTFIPAETKGQVMKVVRFEFVQEAQLECR